MSSSNLTTGTQMLFLSRVVLWAHSSCPRMTEDTFENASFLFILGSRCFHFTISSPGLTLEPCWKRLMCHCLAATSVLCGDELYWNTTYVITHRVGNKTPGTQPCRTAKISVFAFLWSSFFQRQAGKNAPHKDNSIFWFDNYLEPVWSHIYAGFLYNRAADFTPKSANKEKSFAEVFFWSENLHAYGSRWHIDEGHWV